MQARRVRSRHEALTRCAQSGALRIQAYQRTHNSRESPCLPGGTELSMFERAVVCSLREEHARPCGERSGPNLGCSKSRAGTGPKPQGAPTMGPLRAFRIEGVHVSDSDSAAFGEKMAAELRRHAYSSTYEHMKHAGSGELTRLHGVLRPKDRRFGRDLVGCDHTEPKIATWDGQGLEIWPTHKPNRRRASETPWARKL